MTLAGLLGITQGAPGVIQGRLDRADQLFAQCQATSQGARQGAAGTVVAAGQPRTGKGMGAAVAAIEPVMDILLIAVAARDQQILAALQQFVGTLVSGAVGQLGKNAGFGQVGGDDPGERQQLLAHGVANLVLAQRAATAGAQYRVADQGQLGVGLHDLDYGIDHLQTAEHTQLDGGDGHVAEHGIGLGQYPFTVEHAEVDDIDGVLHGQGSYRRCGVTTLGDQGFDIGLQTGTATGIVAGQAEYYGTKRSRRIHALSLPSAGGYRYGEWGKPAPHGNRLWAWADHSQRTRDYNNNQRRKLLMKTINEWFEEYGESHRNPVNKLVHWICVPLITFSVLGILWALDPLVAVGLVGLALVFYLLLSWQLAAVMLVQSLLMLWILSMMPLMFWPSVVIFVLAWVGQFIGHQVEGKKPSFFKDVQFLLIGPAWLMGFVFRRLGWRY